MFYYASLGISPSGDANYPSQVWSPSVASVAARSSSSVKRRRPRFVTPFIVDSFIIDPYIIVVSFFCFRPTQPPPSKRRRVLPCLSFAAWHASSTPHPFFRVSPFSKSFGNEVQRHPLLNKYSWAFFFTNHPLVSARLLRSYLEVHSR